MAIQVECLSLIIPISTIEKKYPGGWHQFRMDRDIDDEESLRVCSDGELFRTGAMNPMELQFQIDDLKRHGFKGLIKLKGNQSWKDFCVFDSFQGPSQCEWLRFNSAEGTVCLK